MFTIQWAFGRKCSELEAKPLEETLRKRSSLYKQLFGDLLENDSLDEWKSLVQKLEKFTPHEAGVWIYQLYRSGWIIKKKGPSKRYSRSFGPFRYAFSPENEEISIHLSIENEAMAVALWTEGRKNLKEMLSEIKATYREAKIISIETTLLTKSFWKRLLPFEEIHRGSHRISIDHPLLMSEALWSQFFDFKQRPKTLLINRFIKNVESATTLEELLDSFPIPPKIYKGKLTFHYAYYNVS